jgi:myo-inositol-1(or 4)-monophosphatase
LPARDPVISAAEDLELLRDAAREAGAIAMRYFGKNPQVWMKGGTSPVSEADHAADAYLRQTLLAARPDYG